jgi:hypothetical protein
MPAAASVRATGATGDLCPIDLIKTNFSPPQGQAPAEPSRNLGELKRLGRSLALPNPVLSRERNDFKAAPPAHAISRRRPCS